MRGLRNLWQFLLGALVLGALVIVAAPTWAQGRHPLREAFAQPLTLGWFFGSMVFFYLCSVLFTIAMNRNGYPPHIARFGCWFSLLLWALFIGFGLFGIILAVHLATWMVIVLFLLVMVFGVVLLSAKKTVN